MILESAYPDNRTSLIGDAADAVTCLALEDSQHTRVECADFL
jgi:hypothetical protein